MSNVEIRFDAAGAISMPVEIGLSDSTTFDLIKDGEDLIDNSDMTLSVALAQPLPITEGIFTFTYDGFSESIPARDVTSYSLELLVNTIPGLEGATAGKWTHNGGYYLNLETDAADTLTVSHDILGSLTSRVTTGNSDGALFIDLSIQKLANTATFTAITAADLTISEVTNGASNAAQHNRITLTRTPDIGKWRINIDAETSTAYLRPDASAYEVAAAYNDVAPYPALVARRESGNALIWDIVQAEVGVRSNMTVSDTLYGPVGEYAEIDMAGSDKLLALAGLQTVPPCKMTLTQSDRTLFSQLIDVHGAITSLSANRVPA